MTGEEGRAVQAGQTPDEFFARAGAVLYSWEEARPLVACPLNEFGRNNHGRKIADVSTIGRRDVPNSTRFFG